MCLNFVCSFQYRNAGNPLAHYDGTGEEIVAQCDGRARCQFNMISQPKTQSDLYLNKPHGEKNSSIAGKLNSCQKLKTLCHF